ncbi:MAG: hypothetical protein HYZ12_00935 [Thaumarchaeota archaeon]|nr:hypothetical protein [Nitrososphaerota archaeon]
MARDSKVDGKLVKGLQESLTAVLGESGAKALVKLGGIPENRFDPESIDTSLSKVFGASREGLSIMRTNVLKGMSTRLEVGELGSPTASNFVKSLEAIADTYRLKEKAVLGGAGFAAGILSSICCLGLIAFALLGFASLSASLTLATDLTSSFKPIELGASVAFLAATVFFQLRRHGECSLSGVRRNLAYIAIPGSALLVTYAVVNYWVAVTFFGGAGSLLP